MRDGKWDFSKNPNSLVFEDPVECLVTVTWGDGRSKSARFVVTDPRFKKHDFPQIEKKS
jgi:hypothetical protein